MKNLLIFFTILLCLKATAQKDKSELHEIRFYAYTPKLLSVSEEAYLSHSWNYKTLQDKQYSLDYKTKYFTNINWFLPLLNKRGWSIINETRFRFSTSAFNNISKDEQLIVSDKNINSNFLNSFVKVNKVIPFGNKKRLVFSGQMNYYGHNVIDFQKIGGSVTAIVYTRNTSDKSVGFGMTYDMNYHMSPIVPLIIYYQKLPRNYNLKVFLPWKIGLQKILNERTYLYVGSRLAVHLDFVETQRDVFDFKPDLYETRNTLIKNHINIQRAVTNFLWLEFEVGYNYSFVNYYVEPLTLNEAQNDSFLLKTNSNGITYATIGVFLRPVSPKK